MNRKLYKTEDVEELRPYRLQYNFKEACYMLSIKDPKKLKDWCIRYEIPFHKMEESGNLNYILHDDLVKLIDKVKVSQNVLDQIYGNHQPETD